MSDPIIKIQNMNKWFGDFQVLKNINPNLKKKDNNSNKKKNLQQHFSLQDHRRIHSTF